MMRYLKTYETFQGVEDSVLEIAGFLDGLSVEERKLDPKWGDTSMFKVFSLMPNKETNEDMAYTMVKLYLDREGSNAWESLERYMREEKGMSITFDQVKDEDDCKWPQLVMTEIESDPSLYSPLNACLEWLKKNFDGVVKAESKSDAIGCQYTYVDRNGKPLFNVFKDKIFFTYEDVTEFFVTGIGLERDETIMVLKKWMEEIGLKDLAERKIIPNYFS